MKPNEFIPERWTTRPELVLNRSAFVPFGTGKLPAASTHRVHLLTYDYQPSGAALGADSQ